MKKETISTIVFCIILLMIFNINKIQGLNLDKSSNSEFQNKNLKDSYEISSKPTYNNSFSDTLICKTNLEQIISKNFYRLTVIILSNKVNEKLIKFKKFIDNNNYRNNLKFPDIDLEFIYDCKLNESDKTEITKIDSFEKEFYEMKILEKGNIVYSRNIKPKIKEILKMIKNISDLNFSTKKIKMEFLRFLKDENSNDKLNNELESFKKIDFTDHIPSLTFFLNMGTYKKVNSNNKALKLVLSFFLILATSILTFLVVKSSVDWANNSKTELNKYYEQRNQKIIDKLCQNSNYFKRVL